MYHQLQVSNAIFCIHKLCVVLVVINFPVFPNLEHGAPFGVSVITHS
jgi:hypothetical protein